MNDTAPRDVAEKRLEFRILGPLEVRADGASLPVGGPRQRALLALLLLSANRVVSRDRLIEELAQDQNGQVSDRALKVQASRLRKALTSPGAAEPRLLARSPGYVLRVEPGELDLELFEQSLAEGRQALADDDPERAADVLREGLSLWRGRPLADLEFEPFARMEVERLEELRLGAIEEWVDAELQLGRHSALVPELEALAAEHPLRERLQGQLMLALYRSARHADALRVYADSRRRLADELGLEPTRSLRDLELAILRQDPSLDRVPAVPGGPPHADEAATVDEPEPAVPAKRRLSAHVAAALRGHRRAALAVLLAAVTIATAVPLTQASGGKAFAAVPRNSIGVIDPKTDRIVAVVPVGARPGDVAAGRGAVWVLNRQDETVSRIDPVTKRVVRTIRSLPESSRLSVGSGGVWVTSFELARISGVARLDPASNVVGAETYVPASRAFAVVSTPVAAGSGAVWLTNGAGLYRIDARSQRLVKRIVPDSGAGAVAVGAGAVWVGSAAGTDAPGTVVRLAPSGYAADDVVATIPVPAQVTAIAIGAGAVWVAAGDTVLRISPATNTVTDSVSLGHRIDALAAGSGGVWAASGWSRTVTRVDPATRRVVKTVRVGGRPAAVAAGGGDVWVSVD